MAHWGKIREIKRHSTSIGKTQHDMNVEIFTYAYRAVYPTKTDRSPYLNICDIPTAPKASSAFTCTPHSNCSICGSYVENSSFCYKCKSRYLNDRSSGSFPTPFTKRIFGPENWKDIQFIKRRGKKLGKTEEEIKQAISDYAQKAVVEMQTNASLHTTVVHSIFCTPDPQPAKRTAPVTQNPPTPVSPPPAASSGKQPSPPIPKKHPKLTLLFWKKYDEITRDFKYGQCHVCKKWYWTKSAVKNCCANDIRKKQLPVAPPRIIPRQPLSPYRFTEPCPICKGEGYIRGIMCPDCDGRGSLRIF